jgi:hypothetical protein
MQQLARMVASAVLLTLALASAGAAEQVVSAAAKSARQAVGAPSLDITIATGAAGDDDLAQGLYIFHLKCSGSCDLDRITLNQCSKSKHGETTFVPRVDEWSTTTNRMTAAQVSDSQIRLTVYQAFEHQLPAQMTLTFNSSGPPFTNLVDLKTTGFLDLREFPKLREIEYVPISDDRVKALNCPVFLPGLKRGTP